MLRGPGEGVAWGQGTLPLLGGGGFLTAQQGQGHRMALGTSEPRVAALVGCNPTPPQPTLGKAAGGACKRFRRVFLGWKAKISSSTPSARDFYHGCVCCPQPRHPQLWSPGWPGGCVGDIPSTLESLGLWQRDGSSSGGFPRFPAASPVMPDSPSGIERGSCCQPGCTQIPS